MKHILIACIAIALLACNSTQGLTGNNKLKRPTDESVDVQIVSDTIDLFGTLALPRSNGKAVPLAIMIAGSGPTDRNCNNPMGESNTYKMIAEGLMESGIATLRYDKRMVGESAKQTVDEKDVRFDHMIDDAVNWVNLFQDDKRFNKIIIMGHSEGSLVGMVTARLIKAEKFISLAGAGRSADVIILDQIGKQMPFAVPNIKKIFDRLKTGEIVEDIDPSLNTILRPSVQPYMASWFKFDPAKEIEKLDIPCLIVQGSTDIQVGIKDAQLLDAAASQSTLKILEGTNHIFKDAPTDFNENIKTYTDPTLALNTELLDILSSFILN